MRITIDTKEDSPEDINKAIRLIRSLMEEQPQIANQGNIFDSDEPTVTPTETPSTDTISNQPPPQGNVFGNLFEAPKAEDKSSNEDKEEDHYVVREQKREIPEIVPYH